MRSLSRDSGIYEFRAGMTPALTVTRGETVRIQMMDCFGGQIRSESTLCSEIDFDRINPATGPIFVHGAEPGDTLVVEILGMDLSDRGVAVAVPGEGLLGHMVEKPSTRVVSVIDGYCHFNGVDLPIKPMIGVMGVAPREGACPTGTPDRHGGNMDTTAIGPGATVYLPVGQPGALLAMGDCHAVMGDGEVGCSGCEIEASATVKLDLVKGISVGWPMVESEGELSLIVSGDDLDDALAEATKEVVSMLQRSKNLSWNDAYILASLAMDLRISQLVDPKKTVRAVLPRRVISAASLFRIKPSVRA